jgi:hypothetical protein
MAARRTLLAMRLILDLHSRTNGQPSPRCFAGWQFKHND